MLRKFIIGLGFYVQPRAAWHIVEDYRCADPVRNEIEMLYQSCLRCLVVVRRDHKQTVGSGSFRVV